VPSKIFGFSILAKPTSEKCLSGFWIVRNLGNFSINLIQKKIKNKFVASYMCTYDLSNMDMYMILIIMILLAEDRG